jgi:hypothetical protein
MSKRDMIFLAATLTWCALWCGIFLVAISH